MVVSAILGVLLASIIRQVMRLGVLIMLLVATLVITGVVQISTSGGDTSSGSTFSLGSIYTLGLEVYSFLSQFMGALQAVFMAGGVDGALAAVIGFGIGWFGLSFLPVRRRD